MTNIFDTHAHYSSRQFDADRDAVMLAGKKGQDVVEMNWKAIDQALTLSTR